jgi:hypothetical protein
MALKYGIQVFKERNNFQQIPLILITRTVPTKFSKAHKVKELKILSLINNNNLANI